MMIQKLVALAAVTLVCAAGAQAEDAKQFDGFYLGGEFGHSVGEGYDNIYYGATGAFRKQLDNNLVLGLEGSFGKLDYPLIDHVWSLNGTLGYAFGDEGRNMIFVGAGNRVTNGDFFRFANGSGSNIVPVHNINDFNAFVGYERAIGSNLSLRLKAEFHDEQKVVPTIGFGVRF